MAPAVYAHVACCRAAVVDKITRLLYTQSHEGIPPQFWKCRLNASHWSSRPDLDLIKQVEQEPILREQKLALVSHSFGRAPEPVSCEVRRKRFRSSAPFTTSYKIRRIRRGTGSCHRHKGHDDPRRRCRLSGRVARAASPAATPPCGYGSSRNRQLPGAVTSNPPAPALTCASTLRQLPIDRRLFPWLRRTA